VDFAASLMRSAYRRHHRPERVGQLEAMMKERRQQLDLLILTAGAIQHPELDPIVRSEVTSLLQLLLKECSAVPAKAREADDEQDHA
jgi:hypothetical protein